MKPEKFDFATKMFEEKVIPTLRKQKGFRDEISFVDKEHGESVAISFWDSEADALKYEKDVYPKMLEALKDAYTGKLEVKHFEVANSTWYKIHATH
jgi:heme-degrading monooxygenase HmoA